MPAVVYAETFGNLSEAWMHRQVAASGAPLITHEHRNADLFPLPAAHVVPRSRGPFDRALAAVRWLNALHGYRLPVTTETRVSRVLQELRATAIHAHYGPAGARMEPLARRLDCRLYVTFHGFDASVLPQSDRSYRRALKTLFPACDRVLAVSRTLSERVERLGCPPGKLEVLPMGVPLRPLRPLRAAPRERVRAVTVARLHPVKGVPDLLDAVAAARAQGAPLELDVVGDGPERAEVEARAAPLRDAVRLHGMLPPAEVARLLDEGDLFVLNSRVAPGGDVEGLPVSLLEAMAAGLPVVATRHGGIPEAVRHEVTGLLVPERDGAALAAALARLARDPAERVAFGAAGRAVVEMEYDAQRSVARLLELYRDDG